MQDSDKWPIELIVFWREYSVGDFGVILDYNFLKTDSVGAPILMKYPDTLKQLVWIHKNLDLSTKMRNVHYWLV